VHSRYTRELADAGISAQRVILRLRVRRLFCDNNGCVAKTFTEQVADLTEPYARRTVALRRMLETIALALAGRPGVRLATRLGLAVSRDSLLRLLRALPDPPAGMVTVLGVDDFATKPRAVLCHDLDRPSRASADRGDRDADTLAAWLTDHPEVQIITRDRSGAYADAATRGAPQATQCADRWHLWKNLGEAVEKTVVAHRGCLRDPQPPEEGQADGTGRASDNTTPVATGASLYAPERAPEHATAVGAPEIKSRLEDRFQQRYAQVQALRAHGKGMRTIGEELDLDRKTVRRFLQATSVEELLAKTASQTTLLEKYQPYLHQRWNEGCTNISQLLPADERDPRPGLPRKRPHPLSLSATLPNHPHSASTSSSNPADDPPRHGLDHAEPRKPG
jgi:hypothetical protein